jgi:cytochrome c-type biogenesis protein CcmH
MSAQPRVLLLALLAGLAAAPALAVDPAEMLADPVLEGRARDLGRDLRCLVCQNQSIDESDADLARDLRVIVRERITAGDSDAQVKRFLVDRYGDFVLLTPPFKTATLALWLGPLGLVGLAGAGVALFYRRRRTPPAAVLSPEEQRRVERLMKESGR